MRTRGVAIGAACLLLLGAASAAAQDAPKAGITMGYPSSFGVLWQVSERVAVRPELSVSQSSGSSSSSLPGSIDNDNGSDGWALGTGASLLFTLHKSDNLRTYVAPRFSYSRSSSDSDTGDIGSGKSTTDGYAVAGLFGAEYSLGRRFSVFGEVGVGYSSQKTTSTISLSASAPSTATFTARSHGTGTRTGVGVILYF